MDTAELIAVLQKAHAALTPTTPSTAATRAADARAAQHLIEIVIGHLDRHRRDAIAAARRRT